MIGVAGGLIAALFWGVSAIAASYAMRSLRADVAVLWVFATGLVVVAPFALAGDVSDLSAAGLTWAIATGAVTLLAVVSNYVALRDGAVSATVPIMATGGAVAAVIAIALGEDIRAVGVAGLIAVLAGTLVTIRARSDSSRRAGIVSVVAACLAAAFYGVSFYASARATKEIGTASTVFLMRLVGVVALAAWLLGRRRLALPRGATRFVLFAGVADTTALAAYTIGADHDGVAVTAVLASQYAAVAAILGVIHFRERLTRPQLAGVVVILVGVAIVTAAQA